jgi:cytochrome P450
MDVARVRCVACLPVIVLEADLSSIIHFQGSWKTQRKLEEKLGDTFLLVNPLKLYLKTSNAELATQVTTRRTDFTKPTEGYGLVDIFGKSILTQEGQEWRRHRKIVGPSFSEKSNRLVFEESLRQTESMMKLWATQGTNSKAELKVLNTSEDAATLSLHVICAAGFGVPQVWPNETEENLEEKGLQAFSKFKLTGGHTLSFKDALIQLLKHILWFVLFTPSMLSKFWSRTCGGVECRC